MPSVVICAHRAKTDSVFEIHRSLDNSENQLVDSEHDELMQHKATEMKPLKARTWHTQ